MNDEEFQDYIEYCRADREAYILGLPPYNKKETQSYSPFDDDIEYHESLN
jgi:hypothetical protein